MTCPPLGISCRMCNVAEFPCQVSTVKVTSVASAFVVNSNEQAMCNLGFSRLEAGGINRPLGAFVHNMISRLVR